jgi:hypothetical protein
MLGVPVFYATSKTAGEQKVIALDGTTAWIPDDRELKKFLTRGVLLDANAVDVLHQRGFGRYVGAGVKQTMEHHTSAEIFLDDKLEKRMPLRIARGNWSELFPSEKSKVLTTFVDPVGARYPGTILYKNELGGRIVIYAGKNSLPDFHNHARVRWLNGILDWMSCGTFPIYVQTPQRIITIRKDRKKQTVLAFANMSCDPLRQIHCDLKNIGKARNVRILSPRGQWLACDASILKRIDKITWELSIKTKLSVYDFMILLVDH